MKIFTIEQANSTLPYVRRIVEDIVRTYAEWQDRVREFEVEAATLTAAPSERADALQREVQALAAQIEAFRAEVEALGARMKAFDAGLVDFPGEIDGRVVLLCWRLGEPSVQHWHELDAGFAGRQPIPPAGRLQSAPSTTPGSR